MKPLTATDNEAMMALKTAGTEPSVKAASLSEKCCGKGIAVWRKYLTCSYGRRW